MMPKEERIRLFVYGTLRKGGLSAHYLKEGTLVQEKLSLSGYALYDAGWYPFAVPAEASSVVVGDVFELPQYLLPSLDEYEGPEYSRKFLSDHKMLIYLKKEIGVEGFPLVTGGDWLNYWEQKSR